MQSAERKTSGPAVQSLLIVAALGGLAYLDWKIYGLQLETAPLVATLENGKPASDTTGDRLPAGVPVKSAAAYPQSVARPLFHPDRRPFDPPKPVVAAALPVVQAPALEADKLQLIGVMLTGSDKYRALIRNGEDAGEWLVVGDQIQGWKLRAIAPDGVVLATARPMGAGSTSQEVKLRF